MKFVKFPKIRQFRDIVKHVKSKADFKGLDDEGAAIFEHTEAYPTLDFEGTVKLHGCFEKNSKVLLANGEYVPISEIEEGTYVQSFDHKSKTQTTSKVIKIHKNILLKKWVMLKFDGFHIKCTSDHPFFTNNRGWVHAIEITMDDDIAEFVP